MNTHTHSVTSSLNLDDNPFLGQYPQPGELFSIPQFASYFNTIHLMSKDDQIFSSLDIRKKRALALPVVWSGDKAAIDFIQTVILDRITFTQDQMDGLAAIELGFNPCEVDWSLEDGLYIINRIEKRDPTKFRVTKDGGIVYKGKGGEWIAVPEKQVIVFTRDATREFPYGKSVLEPCFPVWKSKIQLMEQIERLGHKFSVPPAIALCETDDQNELDNISSTMAQLSHSDAVALSGVKDIKTLTITGKVEELENSVKRRDESLSKILTGQVLASNTGDSGSYAQARTHENTLDSYAIGDLNALLNRFNNTIFRWCLELNGMENLSARLLFDEETYKKNQSSSHPHSNDSQPAMTLSDVCDPEITLFL